MHRLGRDYCMDLMTNCGNMLGSVLRYLGASLPHFSVPLANESLGLVQYRSFRWYTTVILKLTLRHKTDSTERAAADCADFASACRFRSFRRFYVSFFPNFPVMLIVLDH